MTVGVVGLAALGAVIRFWTLGDQSYWYDEALTVVHTRATFGDMLNRVYDLEVTPPLYYAVAWVWTRVFGDSEVGLRSLSTVAGTLTVPVVYGAARALVGRRAGLAAAALVALSPVLISYSQEARPYALLLFLCALSLMFFARALRRPDRRNFAGWGVSSALALPTHYFAAFLLVPEAVWLLVRSANRRAAAIATGAVALAGIALAPIALHQRAGGGGDWIANEPLNERLRFAAKFFATGTPNARYGVVALFIVAFGFALALAIRRGDSRSRRAVVVAFGLGAVALALPLGAALVGSDFVLYRNLLPAWLPLAIVLAAGVTVAGTRWTRAAGIAIGLFVIAVFVRYDHKIATDEQIQRDDWRGVVEVLGPARADRVIVVAPGWQVLALSLYQPHIAFLRHPLPVDQVDTIVYEGTLPRPASRRIPLDPAFRRVQTETVQRRIAVVRYRAAHPTLVTPLPAKLDAPVAFLEQGGLRHGLSGTPATGRASAP